MPSSIETIKSRVLNILRSAKEAESNPDIAWRIMASCFFVGFLGVLVGAFLSYYWATGEVEAAAVPKGQRSPVSGAEIAEAAAAFEKRAAEHEAIKLAPSKAPDLRRGSVSSIVVPVPVDVVPEATPPAN